MLKGDDYNGNLKRVMRNGKPGKREVKIEASIACANFKYLEKDIRELEECGIDLLHIDIMDGTFVPNIALNFSIIKDLKEMTHVPIECHLMIQDPERYVETTAQMGASSISVHAEATKHIQRVLAQIRNLGVKAGIALNPATPIDILDYILDDLDLIILMTVNPGFTGQKLVPATLKKIKQTRDMINRRGFGHIDIQVDGNVSIENIPAMVKAGATMLVGGTSSIFRKDHSITESMALIRTLY